jgi:putative ABC transport system ATP-binding protein
MIHTRNLVKSYRSQEVQTPVLINVNIDIGDGEYVAIAGPSGSGKSSLFNIMGLLEQPDEGEIFFMGREVSSLNDRQRMNLRRGNIGYVFREFNLVDELSVVQNIELPLLYMDLSRKQRKKMLEKSLYDFKLEHIRKNFPGQLTGLQQQITALARATVFNPSLLLADEPTGNLNSTSGNEIFELLSGINESGTTVVVFTNSISDAQKTQRIIQLFDGHVVTDLAQKVN